MKAGQRYRGALGTAGGAVKAGKSLRVERPADAAANADMRAMVMLRASLDALALELTGDEKLEVDIAFTRASAIRLLDCLCEGLSEPLQQTQEGDPVVILDHPAIGLLREIALAFQDLDRSKAHKALQPASSKSGASRPSAKRRKQEGLLELLEIFRNMPGINSYSAAAKHLIDRRSGITPKDLLELRKTNNRRKRG